MLEMDIVNTLKDYNDGLLIPYIPFNDSTVANSNLWVRTNELRNDKSKEQNIIFFNCKFLEPLCFIYGHSIEEILDTKEGNHADYPSWNISQHVHFIGNLSE